MSKTLGQRLADLNIEVGTAMTINWHSVHIHAAIASMQGMLSSKETMVSITRQAEKHNISVQTALAELSVGYADALIEELKKRWKDEND